MALMAGRGLRLESKERIWFHARQPLAIGAQVTARLFLGRNTVPHTTAYRLISLRGETAPRPAAGWDSVISSNFDVSGCQAVRVNTGQCCQMSGIRMT